MIATIADRVLRALLGFVAARPALRRSARSLVSNVSVLRRLVSKVAATAQADMLAAARKDATLRKPTFGDHERVATAARAILSRHAARSMPTAGKGGAQR